MKSPVFHDSEHEAFYYRMLAERRCTDSYHRVVLHTGLVERYPRPYSGIV